ncbi:MAG: metallophosphoesterase [Eubacteriales bacterium]
MSDTWEKYYGFAKKVPITLSEQGRTIVLSDIHGNLPFLKGILKKLSFSQEDTLIFLGDMLEKGKYSLQTLRFIMELEKTHRVYTLCGNCDAYILLFFETDDFDSSFFQDFLRRPLTKHSMLRQMGREAGVKNLNDLPLLRKTIRKTHKDIWDYLKQLPTIFESEKYFFVHGGVDTMEDNPRLLAWDCMKNDHFHEQDHCFTKYMIVGHCPTTLYHEDFQNASPIIDHERKIISIDGGCVLKLDGQLNALILEDDKISYDNFDGLPLIRALESQNASENPLNIRWGHNKVKIISQEGEFSLCTHLETGKQIKILTKFLHHRKDSVCCEDATDYLLPIQKGDIFSYSEEVSQGVLGKKEGVTGWYLGKYEKI